MAPPPPDFVISRDIAAALLERYLPQLADATIGEGFNGWDNVSFRIGTDHVLRLPRLHDSVPLLRIEQRWLPSLDLPVKVPQVVATGEPSELFPAPWSLLTWIDGVVAGQEPLSEAGLADLGAALAALHRPAPADAPVCPWRATPLREREDDFLDRLKQLGTTIDGTAAHTIYGEAADAQSHHAIWIHADLHALNLISDGGRLTGIIDWGEMSAGDPLEDLGQARVLAGAEGFDALLDGYGRRLGEAETTVLRGHAVDAATRLALASTPAHREPAWRTLGEFGLVPTS